jgi:transcriptional regulator with XRE-family HTH domain
MKTQHEVLMEDPEFRRLLAIEALVAESSEAIARLMADQNVSKADLARRLNKSRAWVTQLLGGKANMTVRTLAEVVYALDAEVKLHAEPANLEHAGKTRPSVVSGQRVQRPPFRRLTRPQRRQTR